MKRDILCFIFSFRLFTVFLSPFILFVLKTDLSVIKQWSCFVLNLFYFILLNVVLLFRYICFFGGTLGKVTQCCTS